MATTDKRLDISELDFDDIKSNLKTFLRNQSEFTDYDFEGSGMSALLDLLAYNTHYLSMNANLLANEMFIDTASLRSSVVSHAKTLGYTPRSVRAPQAVVDVTINDTSVTTSTLSRGTKFSTTVDDITYNFLVNEDRTVSRVDNVLTFDNVTLFEGTLITTRYVVDNSNVDQRFIIPDSNADTTTLTVVVQNSATDSTQTTYNLATDITQVTDDTNAYFLQEIENGQFQVYFGDSVIGRGLSDDNIVILQYIVTNKGASNGASTFTPPSSIGSSSDNTVATVTSAVGGAEAESIESIKLNAPLDYASQGRAVTTNDFKVIVPTLFANTQSVSVWGGEDNDPASYGKVFISVKTTTGSNLTSTQKTTLQNNLKDFVVSSVRPEVVDPQTINVRLTVNFKYNSTVTSKSLNDLASLVNTTISNYNTNNLGTFNSPFRYSELIGQIDDSDSAINSNITTVQMSKTFTPTLNEVSSYTIAFNNALFNPHSGHASVVSSTGFKVSGSTNELFLQDDGKGVLQTFYLSGTTKIVENSAFGTVDYATGKVILSSANIISISNVDDSASTSIRVVVVPASNDVVPLRNDIIEIDISNSTITGQVDTVTSSAGSATTSTSTAVTSASTSSSFISSSSSSSGY